MPLQQYSSPFCAKKHKVIQIKYSVFLWQKQTGMLSSFFCIANVFDLLLSSKDVYSFKCLFANNLNQYITSWSKSPFRWLNGNESISWRHRKCFSKLCVHRMRTKTPNWCADLVKRSEMFENQHVTSYRIFKILPD